MQISRVFVFILGFILLFPLPVWPQGNNLDSLLQRLQTTPDMRAQLPLLIIIGQWYDQKDIPGKSIEYLQRAYDLGVSSLSAQEKLTVLHAIGRQYREIRDYSNAIDSYEQALALAHTQQERIDMLQQLAQLNFAAANLEQSLYSYQQLLPLCTTAQGEIISDASLRIGQLQQILGRPVEALASIENAIANSEVPEQKQKCLLQKALCLIDNNKSHEAQVLLEQLARSRGGLLRLEAATQLLLVKSKGKKDKAFLKAVTDLSKQAEEQLRTDLLPDIYRMLAEAHRKQKNYQQAEYYAQLLVKLEATIRGQDRDWQEQFMQKEIVAERKENQLKETLARQQQYNASLTQSRLERQKQEQELALKERALEMLKKEEEFRINQLAQQLKLAQQRTLTETQAHQTDLLRQEAERQRLLAEKLEADQLTQQQALNAAQEKSAHHEAELAQERTIKQYALFVIALGTALIALLIWAYFVSRRSQKLVQAKSAEIQLKGEELLAQNEELRQTQEELQTQRDYVEDKNKELQRKNLTIASSLNYAITIQQSILPNKEELDKYFAEHFIIYKPKDVVSGDFYWVGGKSHTILGVIDCTGHGIPGAFMSMIGYTLISDIVALEGITSPGHILEEMHLQIRKVLHQETSHNQDGMDGAVLAFYPTPEDGMTRVVFASARLIAYYRTPNGDFGSLEGTRRSVGGDSMSEKIFEEKEILLPTSTVIYIATDGLADQSNPQRRKLGKHNVKQVIESLSGTLEQQKAQLEDVLKEHQQTEEQRDDITVVCVRMQ